MKVNAGVERLVLEMPAARKPMGFICIAPVVAAKLRGGEGGMLTVGNDPATAADLGSFGAPYQTCRVEDARVDEKLKRARRRPKCSGRASPRSPSASTSSSLPSWR